MKTRWLLPIALTIAACEAEPDAVLEPSPWIYEDDRDEATPTMTGDDVAAAIEQALAAAVLVEPSTPYQRYEQIAQMGDGDCPTRFDVYEEGLDTDYWISECTASTGASFSGFAYRVGYADAMQDGFRLNGFVLQFSGRVDGPGGEMAQGSGLLGDVVGVSDDLIYYQRIVNGSFAVDADAAAGTWMDGAVETTLTRQAYVVPTTPGAQAMQLAGALSMVGLPLGSVSFTDVIIGTEVVGGCPLEPSGTISGRDAEGNWYDVTFDGPAELGQPYDGAGCDGCGELWFRGQEMGTACVDFSSLLDWTEVPW
jgi:hypothetical protein